jgi:hypothetical protein
MRAFERGPPRFTDPRENGQSQRAGRFLFALGYLVLVSGQGRDVAIIPAGVLAAMRVRISDAHLLGDLQSFLEAAECRVRKVGPGTLDVTVSRAPSPEQAAREIGLYLKTWQAMNPGTHARLVGEGREGGAS